MQGSPMNSKTIFVLFLITASVLYPQTNHIEALKKGGWSGGLAGWLGWEKFDITDNLPNSTSSSNVDGFNFVFSSRNGSIVETDAVFGFDFQWRQKNRTISPIIHSNANISEELNQKLWFLGLWARYYVPAGGEFAIFFEGSAGYASLTEEYYIINTTLEYLPKNFEASANGFAYNAGAGISIFVSSQVAFEVTGRWEGGNLSGKRDYWYYEDNDLDVKIGNWYILFGFQIFLR